MGAAGWMKVSHASGMFTSWMAFRVILRVLDLGPIVATSLKGFVSLPVLHEKVRGVLPYGGDTILGAGENYGKCQLIQDGQEAENSAYSRGCKTSCSSLLSPSIVVVLVRR
jgi:hypothetical protein